MNTIKYVLLIALLFYSTAHAICPYPTPELCSEYFENDAVFTGRILNREYVSDPKIDNDNDWIQYTSKVIKIYRGNVNSTTTFRTYNGSARWDGDVGKTYVIFLRGTHASATCGPLDDPEYVNRIDKEISVLKKASSSTIQGEVVSKSGPWGGSNGIPVKGEELKVLGKNREFFAITDKDGKFTFNLPPGKYRLSAPGMKPSDYSHTNLNEINLQKGQCAQFQLIK